MTMAYRGNEPLKFRKPDTPEVVKEFIDEVFETSDESPSVGSRPQDKLRDILDDAFSTLVGPRQDTYGAPKESFQQIADFWEVYLSRRAEGPLTTHDVANMMILMKVSRSSIGHHYDSALDIVGYAALKEVI